jgi:hypothetical protein
MVPHLSKVVFPDFLLCHSSGAHTPKRPDSRERPAFHKRWIMELVDITPDGFCEEDPGTCPSVFLNGDYLVIVGKKVDDLPEEIQRRIGPDEDVIEVDAAFIEKAMMKLR